MATHDLKHLKILVVDDQASTRRLMARLLAGLGVVEIESAANGAEALVIVEAADRPVDVAICDLNMPTEDGLVFLRRLAGLDRSPAVILMSGRDAVVLESAQRLGESLDLRILGTIAKPLTAVPLAHLLDALNRVAPPLAADRVDVLTGPEVEAAMATGRFELWFQPQYHVRSGRIVGVEALLRLRDEARGLLTPASFVGPAEECGLIQTLTQVVLEQATALCAAWQTAGWDLTVSINLSKAGLNDLTLPDRAAAMCARRHLLPNRLVFELTESSLAANSSSLLDILARFRLKGFRLSLDDYGTGYASLEELRSLPFHELKIDRQFVQGAVENPRARAILKSTIGLARELNMSTVAEGVETDSMLQMVAGLGCDAAQGYLIAGPMPADELARWLAQRTGQGAAGIGAVWTSAAAGDTPRALRDTVLEFTHDAAGPMMIILALMDVLRSDETMGDAQRDDITQIHDAAVEVSGMIRALQSDAMASTAERDGPDAGVPPTAHRAGARTST